MPKTAPSFLRAVDVPPRAKRSNYPLSFHPRIEGRTKRVLGDPFGLASFGVNYTTLAPGSASALRHVHAVQDEFIYVLEGRPTLVVDEGEFILEPGMCAGFRAAGSAHHLVNRTNDPVAYLEIGDRMPGDSASYPDDDLSAVADGRGGWTFVHKDGTAYE
jgi:uncharacterized cupin superfamily protein